MGFHRRQDSRDFRTRARAGRHLVLGWDGAAREAVKRLLSRGCAVVVVSAARPPELPSGVLLVKGAPRDPETLESAGIRDAVGVLVALPPRQAREALAAAKKLNARARLVACVQEAGAGPSLLAAGASVAIDPEAVAGIEMVRLMLSPSSEPSARVKG